MQKNNLLLIFLIKKHLIKVRATITLTLIKTMSGIEPMVLPCILRSSLLSGPCSPETFAAYRVWPEVGFATPKSIWTLSIFIRYLQHHPSPHLMATLFDLTNGFEPLPPILGMLPFTPRKIFRI